MLHPFAALVALLASQGPSADVAETLGSLPVLGAPSVARQDPLLEPAPFEARAGRSADGRELVLDNGLLRRAWRIAPNAACVGFDDLVRGESLLRSVRPEARLVVDGVPLDVGGLVGQPNHAYLTEEWLDELVADPAALELVGLEVGEPLERLAWGRRRHAAPGAVWPPKGVRVRLDFALSENGEREVLAGSRSATEPATRDDAAPQPAPPSELGRELLVRDDFEGRGGIELLDRWREHTSSAHARSSVRNEGKAGEILTPANTSAFLERAWPDDARLVELTFDAGTDRTKSWGPGLAVDLGGRTVKLNVRTAGNDYDGNPELGLWDGESERTRLGGRVPFDIDGPVGLRLRLDGRALLCDARAGGGDWLNYARVQLAAGEMPRQVRIGKLDLRGRGEDFATPGDLVRLRLISFAAYGPVEGAGGPTSRLEALRGLVVSVHYELYDGIPALSKWLTVTNRGAVPVTIDRLTVEELAVVEHANWVEARDGVDLPRPETLHVETDFAFGGFNHANANRHVVHWRTDPEYSTQVNYLRQSPCLLVCEPTYGPAQDVAAGETFESFRVFELSVGHADRERKGLLLRRMYRTLAPWTTENPLTHHLLSHYPARVMEAVDQAAEVGFEAVILSFGSGFDMENRSPEHLATWRRVAEHAEARGIELGCYSLFSSRGVGDEHMIVSPEGQRPTHGRCPAATSEWGLNWLDTIRGFYEATGFDQFENDGPYPGDVDVTPRPPHQKGELDSRWAQWRLVAGLYRDLRGMGVYINAPDFYFMNGSNKCGMGYREVNWSLPRAQQVIHTRQNIYDGTWTRTPSMGWMFVPLTQYHGGGAAATIEPLDEHRDHYRRMLRSNLAMGVQAHYRGPRLFDTERTKALVRDEVAWFKRHRDILESDVVHGRRADGRDVDWMLHVNPALEVRGMLCVFNPLEREVTRRLRVDLYYTGVGDEATLEGPDGVARTVAVPADKVVDVEVTIPAGEMTWRTVR